MPDNTRRARDELFWQTFADRYAVEPGPINLENGYFGRMSRTVVEEYQRNIEFVNRGNSVYVRQRFEQGDSLKIRAQLARLIGVPAETLEGDAPTAVAPQAARPPRSHSPTAPLQAHAGLAAD